MATNSTDFTSVTFDHPALASGTIRLELAGLLINSANEVFEPGHQETISLDANGVATENVTTPDQTGDSSATWLAQSQESGGTTWVNLGLVVLGYSASAQALGTLLSSTAVASAIYANVTVSQQTYLAALIAANPTAAAWVETAGDTMSGTLAMADNAITRAVFTDYGETVNALGDTGGGAVSIDLESGNIVTATVSTSTTTFSFTNFPASGTYGGVVVILTNGGSQTVNWTNVIWAEGSAPTLTAAGVDRLVFDSVDGGTTIYGFSAGVNFS